MSSGITPEDEQALSRAWHARYEDRQPEDISWIIQRLLVGRTTTPPTGNQLRLAERLEVDISGVSREQIPTSGLRERVLRLELAEKDMRVGAQVQLNGRTRTIREIDFVEGFAVLSFEKRGQGCNCVSRVKLSNLLKHYKVVPPPPEAA